jgi:hypothetical protein
MTGSASPRIVPFGPEWQAMLRRQIRWALRARLREVRRPAAFLRRLRATPVVREPLALLPPHVTTLPDAAEFRDEHQLPLTLDQWAVWWGDEH